MKKFIVWVLMFLVSLLVFSLLTNNVVFALSLMLMIGVHEYGHLLAAKLVGGVETGGFYFLPIGGISLIKGWPKERWKRYVIAIGGPAIGIVLCLLGLIIYKIYDIAGLNLILKVWIFINIFNLIPIYPLDGGRITFQLAASTFKEETAGKIIFFITWIFSVLFFLMTKSIMFLVIIFLLRNHWGRPGPEDRVGEPIKSYKFLAFAEYLFVIYIYNFMATLL